jgi:hypothetical protein
LLLAAVPVAAQDGREPATYMKTLGFTAAEIADMEAGKAVARVVAEKDDFEAAVFAVVRVKARQDAFVEAIRMIETLRAGDPVLQIGRFSEPPRIEDLDALTFDPSELDDLSHCKPGDCELKVGPRALELAHQVNWKAPDARARATRLIKQAMVQLTKDYQEQGMAALPVYNDYDVPQSVAAETEKILRNSPNLARYNPEFVQYLIDYPKASLPDVENFFYWSKSNLRKNVVSIAHVCIQKVTRDGDNGYFVAIKHIYDSHFFRANTEFLTIVPDAPGGGFYYVHCVRARIDPPHSLRGMILGKVKGAMRDALEQEVRRTKQRLERGS